MRLLFRLFYISAITSLGASLQCYICAEPNLDEFGECPTQFQYDCSSYAQKFGAEERIYCRTTRHRAPNNTFTIMKECIAEHDHYSTFPQKDYPLDEECDLIELDGQEVAYCVCRHSSLCNQKPIAEQFMAFEEKHPELFADDEHPTPPGTTNNEGRSASANQHTAFGTPQLQPILPVNDPRFAQHSTDSQRETLPSRTEDESDTMPSSLDSAELDELFRARQQETSSSEMKSPGRIDVPKAPGAPRGGSTFLFSSNAVDGKPISSPARKQKEPTVSVSERQLSAPLPAPVLSEIPPSTLRCAQCGQGQMENEQSDCANQVIVDCSGTDTFCFTRQILLGPGQNAVEKMCVSKSALETEYGKEATVEGCGTTTAGKVRYCVCSHDECNRDSLFRQMNPRTTLTSTSEKEAQPNVDEGDEDLTQVPTREDFVRKSPLPQPQMPAKELPDFTNSQVPMQLPPPIQPVNQPKVMVPPQVSSIPTTRVQTSETTEMNVKASPKIITSLETVSQTNPTSVNTVKSVTVNQHKSEPSTHCVVCSENNLSDPTMDCKNSITVDCGQQIKSEEPKYCVTRQTQLATGVFNLEKRCTTPSQFSVDFPDESLEEGCNTAFDGLVNYCVCAGDVCNQPSLLDQAQAFEGLLDNRIRTRLTTLSPSTTVTTTPSTTENSVKVEWGGLPNSDTSPSEENVDKELQKLMEKDTVEIKMTDEEREIAERQKKWRDAELDLSASGVSLRAVFSTTVVSIIMTLLL